jgi:hypothetical protein
MLNQRTDARLQVTWPLALGLGQQPQTQPRGQGIEIAATLHAASPGTAALSLLNVEDYGAFVDPDGHHTPTIAWGIDHYLPLSPNDYLHMV